MMLINKKRVTQFILTLILFSITPHVGSMKRKDRPTSSKKKIHQCEHCGKQFDYPSQLAHHEIIHSNERPHECDQCHKTFKRKDHLTEHKRIHTGEKPYQCDYPGCDKRFTQNSNLTVHKITHTGERPYQCDYPGCDKKYKFYKWLQNHLTKKHLDATRTNINVPPSFSDIEYSLDDIMKETEITYSPPKPEDLPQLFLLEYSD